ncbi:MAG: mutator MutT protein [uncultured bacterium]|nr:MAG: mutator MutT protein [uncultured bacterium]
MPLRFRKKIQTLPWANLNMSSEIILDVVTGILQNNAGLYFVSLRPPHVPFPNLWEFPGGKIEKKEKPFDALKRELKEEIGIHVETAEKLMEFQHTYPSRIINMSAWFIIKYQGKPHGAEGQQAEWVTLEELKKRPIPSANLILIQHLLQHRTS